MSLSNDLRIVLFGAGSVSFGLSTMGDILTKGEEILAGSTIVLHDINELALKRMSGALKYTLDAIAPDFEGPLFKLEATTDPVEALRDANYCVVSIENGPRIEQWMQDYYIPRKYGSRQVFGENGGPGGAFHSWRQIPAMLKIARTMEDVCPNAWLMNFSNPMSRITWALTKATNIKTVGLCHGIGSAIKLLAEILGLPQEYWEIISAGLNHFYWITKIKATQTCTLGEYGPFKARKVDAGTNLQSEVVQRAIYWAQTHEEPLVEECLRLYGYLPFPDQSHIGEYLPWADAFCPAVKYDYQKYLKGGDDKKARLDRTIEGKESPFWWVYASGERAIDLMVKMETNAKSMELAVNVPNKGTIPNLNPECVVEVPAIIDRGGIHPLDVGPMPMGIAQLMQHEIAVQELVVNAAIKEDRRMAIQALSMDGTLSSPKIAQALFDEMYSIQKPYLPAFK
jgi:alpha-galactosidase